MGVSVRWWVILDGDGDGCDCEVVSDTRWWWWWVWGGNGCSSDQCEAVMDVKQWSMWGSDGCEAVINVSWDGCEGVVGVRWWWSGPVLTLQPMEWWASHDEVRCIQCGVVVGTSGNDTIATKLKEVSSFCSSSSAKKKKSKMTSLIQVNSLQAKTK